MSKLLKYLIFTFATSYALQILSSHDLNVDNPSGLITFNYAVSMCMFMPTIGVLIARGSIREMGWNPRFGENIKPLLFVWLSPTVFQIVGSLCYFIVYPGDFDLSGIYLKETDPAAFEELKNSGGSYIGYVAREVFSSFTSFFVLPSVIMGMGEEIGWRGFMYPELKERFGRTKGRLLGGVIHGTWHFPLMLLIGYEYGYDYIGAPVFGLFVFCIFTVTTGIITDYIYEKSGSIWFAGMLHGTINSSFNPYMTMKGYYPDRTVLGPSNVGLIAVIPMALFAAGIIYFEKRRESMEYADF